MVGSRGVPPHSPHNESLSGQSRTDVATDHKKTGAVASFATRAVVIDPRGNVAYEPV